MDSFNISISRDGIEEQLANGLANVSRKDSLLEDIFSVPPDLVTENSIRAKQQASQEHSECTSRMVQIIQMMKSDIQVKDEGERNKLNAFADELLGLMDSIQENFSSVSCEFDRVLNFRTKNPGSNDNSKLKGYLSMEQKKKKDDSLFLQTKAKIDDELKSKLSDISMIIKDLEQKNESFSEGYKPDHSEIKKIKIETEKKLKEFQDQSQILELSSYIDCLNKGNLSRDDQAKLAFLEEKLNQSKNLGRTELYLSDIYPNDESEVSAYYNKFLEGDIKNFGDDLPPVRINQDENFLSALDDIRSFRDDKYEMSISDMMDFNSLLQTNFYKSLDNYTIFQTECLKKKLNVEITEDEKKFNDTMIEALQEKRVEVKYKNKYMGQEKGLIFIISVLQKIFKTEMGIDIVIADKLQGSDMDKLEFVTNGENKLYSIQLLQQKYYEIIDDPITFEKFVSELKFYIASSLSLDPNLIRIVRIKQLEEGEGSQVDVDIRKSELTVEKLKECSEFIIKNFGEVKYSAAGCVKKFHISLDDFAFQHNMAYGDHWEPLNRGGYPYYFPPSGWRRIGLNVLPKYRAFPPHNDEWISEGNKGWPVAFHGLRYDGLEAPVSGIISGGFSRGWSNYHDDKNFQLDCSPNTHRIENDCIENENQVRVYVTEQIRDRMDDTYEEIGVGTTSEKPWLVPRIAHFNYYRPHKIEFNGTTIYTQIAFQCRINPSAIRVPNLQRDYIIINGPDNVRAYGILFKEVSKQFYEEWNKKYDYMGRFFEESDNVFNTAYQILNTGLNANLLEDLSILGHKKEWIRREVKRFYHLHNRGKKHYDRPSYGWLRLGLNVEKLYPHIDWRARLTRGLKLDTEWCVGYMNFNPKNPNCYKDIQKETYLFNTFSEFEKQANTIVYEGEEFYIGIQCRYNSRGAKLKGSTYIVTKDNLLPYGILLKKKTGHSDWKRSGYKILNSAPPKSILKNKKGPQSLGKINENEDEEEKNNSKVDDKSEDEQRNNSQQNVSNSPKEKEKKYDEPADIVIDIDVKKEDVFL